MPPHTAASGRWRPTRPPAPGGTSHASAGRLIDGHPGLVEGELDDCRAIGHERRPERGLEVGLLLDPPPAPAAGPGHRGKVDGREPRRDPASRPPPLLPHPDRPVTLVV